MIKWSFLSVLLLGFFVSQPYIYSLTDGEKAKLQELSKTDLIKIILVYDQSLNEIEQTLSGREEILSQQESALIEKQESLKETENILQDKENSLNETEAHLKLRETLLAESLNLQKEQAQTRFMQGFAIGGTVGIGGSLLFNILN
jgi:hypothetical protein